MLNVLPSQHHLPGLAGVIRGGKIGNPAGSLPGLAGEVWGAICTVLSVVARAWHPLRLADGVFLRVPSTPRLLRIRELKKRSWVGLRERCKWVLVQTGAHR